MFTLLFALFTFSLHGQTYTPYQVDAARYPNPPGELTVFEDGSFIYGDVSGCLSATLPCAEGDNGLAPLQIITDEYGNILQINYLYTNPAQ